METAKNEIKDAQSGGRPISQGARIGHVHLKVSNIERALGFYCGVLGFELIAKFGQIPFGHRLRRLPSRNALCRGNVKDLEGADVRL